MKYITRINVENYNPEDYIIFGEINEYVEHINVNDNIQTAVTIEKKGENNKVKCPIINGKVVKISKCIAKAFVTNEPELVLNIIISIDMDTVCYLNNLLKEDSND